MAGTVVDGQLSVPVTRRGVRYALATPADDPAIRRLLRENPTRGAIALSFEREPDYFAGSQVAGADDRTILAFERDRLVCMGRATTRPCWLNGEIRRGSYLAELRLDSSVQGRFDILRHGYEFFHALQQHSPAEFTYTSIASDNVRARTLLERGRRGLPRYTFLTEFVTLLIPTRQRARTAVPALGSASAEELAGFLGRESARGQLGTAWSPEQVAQLADHGLPPDAFHVVRREGRIVAAAALWDQRGYRQTVIRGYSPSLAFARPVLNLARKILGKPRLPEPGAVLAHAFLSPLAISPDSESLLPDFVAACSARAAARGLEFITLGFAASDPRLACLRRRFRGRTYASRLYRVGWPGDPAGIPLDDRPFLPEVALL